MKKVLVILALSLGTFQAFSQENVSIGPMVGVSVANFRGDVANTDWKPGLTIGGFYNYSSQSGFGFTGQLLYTQMGAHINNKTNQVNLNYLQVPLLATFYFGRLGDPVRPKIFLGPTANFLLNAKDKDGNNINGDSNNRVYSAFDLGLTAGAGLNVLVQQKVWLNFDVRYGLGLLDVTRSEATRITNQNWGFNVGVSFPLGTYDRNSGRLRTR